MQRNNRELRQQPKGEVKRLNEMPNAEVVNCMQGLSEPVTQSREYYFKTIMA